MDRNKYMREYRKKNIDKVRETERKSYMKNRDTKLEYQKEYNKNNPKKDYQKEYHRKNYDKDKSKKYNQEYLQTEIGKLNHKMQSLRRRELKKKVKHNFTNEEWRRKVELTKGICPHCNKEVGCIKLTVDHIIPLCNAKEGQIYNLNDVQPLCQGCNSRKGTE